MYGLVCTSWLVDRSTTPVSALRLLALLRIEREAVSVVSRSSSLLPAALKAQAGDLFNERVLYRLRTVYRLRTEWVVPRAILGYQQSCWSCRALRQRQAREEHPQK